jgi:hypothetical protein
MQFDRDELMLLSRSGHVPRSSRAGPRQPSRRERSRRARPITARVRRRGAARVRRWVARFRAFGAGVRATWTVFGEGGRDR